MWQSEKITALFLCFLSIEIAYAYKPVIILHGIMSGSDSMVILQKEIEFNHPGTKVYNCDKFSGWSSLEAAWRQVQQIRSYVKEICDAHPEGVHFIGYSQGGLIARAVIQSLPEHNIQNFISLSSPQAGQYGTKFLHLIFPNLTARTAYELFYSRVGQHTSVGNYWNDPNEYELYLKYSVFLPLINNEIKSSNSTQFKTALTKLKKMVLVGGPNDGVITPWQSSHFGFFNKSLDVIPFDQRDIYLKDEIGLKTLQDQDKLVIITRPHVHHLIWHLSPKVIREVILPHLD